MSERDRQLQEAAALFHVVGDKKDCIFSTDLCAVLLGRIAAKHKQYKSFSEGRGDAEKELEFVLKGNRNTDASQKATKVMQLRRMLQACDWILLPLNLK